MQINRMIARASLLGFLVVVEIGCAERGTDPARIESVGAEPDRHTDETLRIATANLWGVAVLGRDWADDIDERFAAMAERLAANEWKLDLVLLQEAWKDSARRALLAHRGVVQNFPFRVDINERPGGAGLVVLSRFPIERAQFHRFRAQGRCLKFWEGDCISGKGIVLVRVKVANRTLWIGNTHLIACYSHENERETECDMNDPNGSDRWNQIVELREMIDGLTSGEPVVLGGDFNFTRTSRYYALMSGSADPDEPQPTAATSAPGISEYDWIERGEEIVQSDRVDYIWTRSGKELRWHAPQGVRPIFTEKVLLDSGRRVPLSDHPVLAIELCLARVGDDENRCLRL